MFDRSTDLAVRLFAGLMARVLRVTTAPAAVEAGEFPWALPPVTVGIVLSDSTGKLIGSGSTTSEGIMLLERNWEGARRVAAGSQG
jgi:hypothetical protein